VTEALPQKHRRIGVLTPRRLAAGGAVLLAAAIGSALLLQNGGSACAAPPSTSAKSGKATFYELGDGTGTTRLSRWVPPSIRPARPAAPIWT
jgi:hypothetical protein